MIFSLGFCWHGGMVMPYGKDCHGTHQVLDAAIANCKRGWRGAARILRSAPSVPWELQLFLVVLRVDFCKALPLFRQVIQGEDGGNGADRDARAAVNALDGIDVEHR